MTMEETSTQVVAPVKAETTPDTQKAGEDSTPSTTTGSSNGLATTTSPRRRRFAKLWQVLRTGVGIWVGLFIAAAGFGLIAFTWSKVAALVNVALQIPYLMSGGLTGLGLIMLGLLVVNLTVKRREAVDRHRQLEEVREALVRLRVSIEGEPEDEE
jgi:hypothetical protein